MARAELYNMPSVSFIVDGQTSSQFGDEFAVRVTFPDTLATVTVGATGVSSNIAHNPTCTIEISYLVTSPSLDKFYELYNGQQAGNGRLFNCSGDTGVNEKISFNKCLIVTPPSIEYGGAEQVPRVVTLSCQEFRSDKSA